MAEIAKRQITQDSAGNSEDFGLGWDGKPLGELWVSS